MKQLLSTNLYIGTVGDYNELFKKDYGDGWCFVSATQTIHYELMGWDRTHNKPDKNSRDYLCSEWAMETGTPLFSLNWVDGGAHLYKWSKPELFIKVLDFIDKWIKTKKVLIFCDQGKSRSPTLGLLYLAKRLKGIPDYSYDEAYKLFLDIYPDYSPSGIGEYVKEHWKEII